MVLSVRPLTRRRYPDGGPDPAAAVITVHSTDNVTRGKIGSFVLNMKPALMLGGMYVNFSVSGTAIAGVDYVLLVSPAYIGQSGYGIIQVQTLADPRGSSIRQAYSVVITLKHGAGYAVGKPSSATMWIKPELESSNRLAVQKLRATLSPRTFRGSVASRLESSPVRIRGLSASTP